MPTHEIVDVSLISKNMFAQQTKSKLTLGVTKGNACFEVGTEKKKLNVVYLKLLHFF